MKFEDLESLQRQLQELKKLREELSVKEESKLDKIKEVKNKQQKLEEEVNSSNDISEALRSELDELDAEIKALEEDVKIQAKEYEESYKKLQEAIDEYSENIDNKEMFTEEKIAEYKEKIASEKLAENERSNEVKRLLDQEMKVIRQLKSKKTRMENNIKKAEALGLTLEEYREITGAIRKTTIMNAILEKKGLTAIIEKSPKERTKEERELLKEAKKEVLEEISQVKKVNESYSVLDAIEALYSLDVVYKEVKKPRVIEIPKYELIIMEENALILPTKIINSQTQAREYSKEKTPEDMQGAMESNETAVDIDSLKPAEEKVTIFKDIDTDTYYARQYAVKRFRLKSAEVDSSVRINGSLCYKISSEDVDKIKNNANNAFSPYVANIKEVSLEKEQEEALDNEVKEELTDKLNEYITKLDELKAETDALEVETINNTILDEETKDEFIPGTNIKRPRDRKTYETDKEYEEFLKSYYDRVFPKVEEKANSTELIPVEPLEENEKYDRGTEKVTIFKEANTNNYYVRRYAAQRYRLKSANNSEETRINGSLCYRISEEDYEKLINNSDNSFSPYITEIKEVTLGKEDNKEEILESEDIKDILDNALNGAVGDEEKEETISEKDINDVIDDALNNLEDEEEIEEIPVGAVPLNDADEEELEKEDIKSILDDALDDIEDEEEKAKGKDKGKEKDEIIDNPYAAKSVEAIIYKITKDLKIKKNDGKKYTASHIKPFSNFGSELCSGNYQYNIVHVLPSIIGLGASILRKLSGVLLLTPRGKQVCDEISKRIGELSEEEFQTLYDYYKGSRLKADMNNQINMFVLEGLKKYILGKVEELNNRIEACYAELFANLEQIEILEKKIKSLGIPEEEKELYREEHNRLIHKTAQDVRIIENCTNEANNLLSSGLHGIEEDFKAVATKLSYIGMRFAKSHNFNNALQKKLAKAELELIEGLDKDNDEMIINGFLTRDQIYYENTEVGYSIFGKRSKGEKYYSPLAERLDYRQDPFIRDLITTIATTTAVVSAVNAYRVHQIEAQEIINAQKTEAARVNAVNDKILSDVGSEATKIVETREAIRKGLVAQMHQDATNVAHTAERTGLDQVNWITGNSTYRAIDDANHAMYNSFYDNMNQQINGIVNNCSAGTITQAEAMNQLAALSSDAQNTFVGVAQNCLDQLRIYAPAHPQYDLHAPIAALEYIVANPTAITEMNTATINATNIAEGLIGLTPEHITALSYLPSDWTTTMINVAGSVALIDNIARNMEQRKTNNAKAKWKRTKNIREMMEDYISEDEEEKSKSR